MTTSSARIVVVGDVHDNWDFELDSRALQFLQPDLVLFTGDFGNENVELVRSIARIDLPKAVILRNHDSWKTQVTCEPFCEPLRLGYDSVLLHQRDLLLDLSKLQAQTPFDSIIFPVGMRVLVVDDNPTCLRILERLLLNCNFNVTTQAVRALQMLRENKDKFDIVISDVHMPDMDGFKLLELIGLELDLPVIMLSANDDPKLVMKGVRHGAVDYLLKPVRIQDVKNIWQHVVRKNRFSQQKGKAVSDSETGDDDQVALLPDGNGNLEREETVVRKRKEHDSTAEDGGGEGDEEDECNADAASKKKARLQWTAELHKKFVAAVDELGPEKAFPKKILDVMNVDGLTRENVASHLQKYRLYLRRLSVSSSKSSDAFVNPFRLHDSSVYPSGRTPLNPYSALCSMNGGLVNSSVASTPAPCHSNLGGFMIPKQNVDVPRLMGMDQFQHQNSSRAVLGRSPCVAAPSGSVVPTLMDYTKHMEKWQGGISSRYTPQNDPLTSFNACNVGYSTVELQPLQELKNGYSNISAASNKPLASVFDPSAQGFGQYYPLQCNSFADSSFGAPSLVQNAEEMMISDDQYLLEDTELLAEFNQDNSGTLDDIVTGFLK